MKEGIFFGCDSVYQIEANPTRVRCECGGNILPLLNLEAFRIARLAHRLGGGYYVHSAILDVAAEVDRSQPIDYSNTREVFRKDGTKHVFAFDHYLREASQHSQTKDDLDCVWLTGALIALGDALERNNYFDRAPHLELLRHLRNGVSHGNRFRIDQPAKLAKFPAHNFCAPCKSPTGCSFEITPALQGQTVLFDFIGPADCVDLFMSVEVHLFSLAVENP
ncbi:hypothetical protein [Paraburkholderia sp. SIMBA_030]|uniref:hypothetical protein n=1 Tax=Paraburkholderia sp. SIMBA_030 TaxID=3085773 RepID=UPI003979C5F1